MYSVILIDDEDEIRNGLRLFVETTQEEFRIAEEFCDGKEAIDYLKDNKADLIITDVKMSKMTGLDVLKYVYDNYPETYVIIISGYKDFSYSALAVKYNACYYITKPTRYKELLAAFANILKLIKSREEKKKREAELHLREKEKNEFFIQEFLEDIHKENLNNEKFQKKLLILDNDYYLRDCCFLIIGMGIADSEKYYIKRLTQDSGEIYDKLLDIINGFFSEVNINSMCLTHKRGIFKFLIYSNRYADVADFFEYVLKELQELSKLCLSALEIDINLHVSKAYENVFRYFEKKDTQMITFDNSERKEENVSEIIVKAKEYIIKNISDDVSLQSVADYVHMNPMYFSRYFKIQTGENFSVFVTNIRMSLAKELLSKNNVKLADVANRIGYSNPAYFSREFKKIIGISPVEYSRKKWIERDV